MSEERLQKLLARVGVGSRRGVEEMIREGRITINGKIADLGDKVDPERDAVKLDGRRIEVSRVAPRSYYLINKPGGYVSTRDDPEGRPTVVDLLPERIRRGLFPVGRLDFETEGLLILTDDGDLALRLTHPRYGSFKTYEVKVKGHPQASAIEKLRGGIVLDGRRTAPVQLTSIDRVGGMREAVQSSWWQVVLREGRTRQIREMFFRIGHPVRRLRRVAICGLRDPKLRLGTWRELTEQELIALRQPAKPPAVEKPPRKVGRRKPRPPAAGHGGSPPRRNLRPAAGPGGSSPRREQPVKGRSAGDRTVSGAEGRGGRKTPSSPAGPKSRKPGGPGGRPAGPSPGGKGGRPGGAAGKGGRRKPGSSGRRG